MKSRQNSKILFLLFTVFFSFQINAQKINLSGRVVSSFDRVEQALIEVYSGNVLLYSQIGKRNGTFKLSLDGSIAHSIVISKKGFASKEIKISKIDVEEQAQIKIPPFKFDVELNKEKDFRYLASKEIKNLVAVLYYDDDEASINWDKNLTLEAHQRIKELKEQNKAKRLQKYRNF